MNIEEKGFVSGISIAGSDCTYIHVSESDRGVPGTGTIDWNEVFRALAATGFKGDLVLESFVTLPAEIASALCVWRDVARSTRGAGKGRTLYPGACESARARVMRKGMGVDCARSPSTADVCPNWVTIAYSVIFRLCRVSKEIRS
jgi:hypothetical protein